MHHVVGVVMTPITEEGLAIDLWQKAKEELDAAVEKEASARAVMELVCSGYSGYSGYSAAAAPPRKRTREAKPKAEVRDCHICYENIVKDARHLPCAHSYHNECIAKWTMNTCPDCRQPYV